MLETMHIVGIALLVGPATAFDLRLLGLARKQLRVTVVAVFLLPLSRLGLVIAAIKGVPMFLPGASNLVERGSAPWKLGLILVAGVNILVVHRRTCRRVDDWDLGDRVAQCRQGCRGRLAHLVGRGHARRKAACLHLPTLGGRNRGTWVPA